MSDTSRPPTCEVRLDPAGRHLTVVLAGELDMSGTDPLTQLAATVDGQFDHVLLDVSGLEFIDSSGLNAFVALRKAVPRLSVRNPRPAVRRAVDVTGLSEFLDVVEG